MTGGKTELHRGEERREQRSRDGEKKEKAAATQQPLASATAQPVTAQPETHCTPLPLSLSLSGKSWLPAGVA